jgi:hypothetical protein
MLTPRAHGMLDFDEDRASITGRKIASNIPPTVAGYKASKSSLKAVALALIIPILAMIAIILFARR